MEPFVTVVELAADPELVCSANHPEEWGSPTGPPCTALAVAELRWKYRGSSGSLYDQRALTCFEHMTELEKRANLDRPRTEV